MKALKIYFFTGLALIVMLSSCSVGKNYVRPDMQLPAKYGAVESKDSIGMARIKWKDFFTDTTLKNLIDSAIHNNYDLQLAIKRVETAQEYLKQAKVSWAPNFDISANVSTSVYAKNSINGISYESFIGTNHLENYALQADMSWEIDIWGKIRRQIEASKANYLQSQETVKAVQTKLVATIASSYFNLLMLDEQLEIARINFVLDDSVVKVLKLQKQAGEVTELAVEQAVVQRQNAEILIPQLEQSISIEETTISILTAHMPGKVSRHVKLRDIKVSDSLTTGVPAELLNQRPDVKASEMALVAANAQVGVAQASLYPALNITASGGLNAFKASSWFNIPGSLFGLLAGGLVQPLFYGRLLRTQLKVAKINREASVTQFRQSVLNAVGEVSNAMIALDKLDKQQQIAAQQVDTLHHAIQNAQMLFKSGMANYLEVITAESSALQSEIRLTDIERQHLDAMVELYRALGGGWE